jgi:hypothetical protein
MYLWWNRYNRMSLLVALVCTPRTIPGPQRRGRPLKRVREYRYIYGLFAFKCIDHFCVMIPCITGHGNFGHESDTNFMRSRVHSGTNHMFHALSCTLWPLILLQCDAVIDSQKLQPILKNPTIVVQESCYFHYSMDRLLDVTGRQAPVGIPPNAIQFMKHDLRRLKLIHQQDKLLPVYWMLIRENVRRTIQRLVEASYARQDMNMHASASPTTICVATSHVLN